MMTAKKRLLPDPSDVFLTELPVSMTLENIIDSTGEMEHLYELIILSIERHGGFTSHGSLFYNGSAHPRPAGSGNPHPL